MRVIVAGGRDFDNYDLLKRVLDEQAHMITRVVSGDAQGADRLGERWGIETGNKVRYFPADWESYGKSAGYKRNLQMADYADGLIAFWDGKSKGTKHMIDIALEKELWVKVYRYDQ